MANAERMRIRSQNGKGHRSEIWAMVHLTPASSAHYICSHSSHPNGHRLMRRSLIGRMLTGPFRVLNRFVDWHRLPLPLALMNFIALRIDLREKNLYDVRGPNGTRPAAGGETVEIPELAVGFRTEDGSFNDLDVPEMGRTGERFGRNFPPDSCRPDMARLMEPNPRTISNELLARREFVPARILNLLAAAWIQFQTHDWFNHGRSSDAEPMDVPLRRDDPWPEHPMRVPRTPPDPTRTEAERDLPPTFINTESHWWDGSSVYGSDVQVAARLRTFEGGRMVVRDGHLPVDPETGMPATGFNENWWVGLGLLHTLFTLEHNAICDRLRSTYAGWSDERLYQTAKLINAALMAKIHTVEWTTAILPNRALQIGMNANWWGVAGERVKRTFGRISKGDVLSGIPGSRADHHGSPFALTEEFVCVYRLHPLIPDEVRVQEARHGSVIKDVDFKELALRNAVRFFDDVSIVDAFYTLGVEHPGAMVLHNFPNFLRNLTLPDGQILDLAAVDILRDRERGIPRYNAFRRLLRMRPFKSFDRLAQNRETAEKLREVYGDIELVDPLVGMLAERPPVGFGFSDTAFRIFILMASRRLKSDRFFTEDFTPRVYTPEGFQWIAENDMGSVLLRHYPELAPALRGVKNAFGPWNRVPLGRKVASAPGYRELLAKRRSTAGPVAR